MDLHSQRLNVVGTVGSSCEIRQVELNLIPTLIQSHGHCAYKGLDTGSRLIIRCSESSADVLVIQNHDLKGEIFSQLDREPLGQAVTEQESNLHS